MTNFRLFFSSPALASYIESYWFMESQTAHTHIIAADGSADIVINCGADLFDLDGRRLSKRGDSLLCTISKGHTYVQSNGGLRTYVIPLRAIDLPHS